MGEAKDSAREAENAAEEAVDASRDRVVSSEADLVARRAARNDENTLRAAAQSPEVKAARDAYLAANLQRDLAAAELELAKAKAVNQNGGALDLAPFEAEVVRLRELAAARQ